MGRPRRQLGIEKVTSNDVFLACQEPDDLGAQSHSDFRGDNLLAGCPGPNTRVEAKRRSRIRLDRGRGFVRHRCGDHFAEMVLVCLGSSSVWDCPRIPDADDVCGGSNVRLDLDIGFLAGEENPWSRRAKALTALVCAHD